MLSLEPVITYVQGFLLCGALSPLRPAVTPEGRLQGSVTASCCGALLQVASDREAKMVTFRFPCFKSCVCSCSLTEIYMEKYKAEKAAQVHCL